MGALFMNMRPFFPATEVMSLFFRPRTTIPPSLLDEYGRQGFVSPAFGDFMVAFKISAPLSDIIEDVMTIRTVGAENILNTAAHSSLSALVDMRDVLLHRILSLAPTGNEPEDESSAEECIRLAALIFVMDKLFFPVLPPAYHGIVHLVTDRLSITIEGKAASPEWASHGWVLVWIVLVSATAHNGDASTRKSLMQSAASLFACHFSALSPVRYQLRSGLTRLVGKLKPFEEEMIDEFAAELERLCRL